MYRMSQSAALSPSDRSSSAPPRSETLTGAYRSVISPKTKPEEAGTVKSLLNPAIKEWFFSTFKDFSLPQLYAVNEIHARKHILISAPTGATKTLTAFM